MSVLLYSAETGTLLADDLRELEAFHTKYLRQLLRVYRWDRVSNSSVLQQTGLTTLSSLSLIGHVAQSGHWGTGQHSPIDDSPADWRQEARQKLEATSRSFPPYLAFTHCEDTDVMWISESAPRLSEQNEYYQQSTWSGEIVSALYWNVAALVEYFVYCSRNRLADQTFYARLLLLKENQACWTAVLEGVNRLLQY